MIKNRLSVLLAERGLKITRVAKDTGISRNTITATAQNDTEMIRLETINSLCRYLNVTPCDFFVYSPIDLDFTMMISEFPFKFDDKNGLLIFKEIDADFFIDVKSKDKTETFQLNCELKHSYYDIDLFNGRRRFSLEITFANDQEKDYFINEFYKELSPFYQDIYHDIGSIIKDSLKKQLKEIIEIIIADYFEDSFNPNGIVQKEMLIDSINDIEVSFTSDVFYPF